MTPTRTPRRVLVVATWYPDGASAAGSFVADQVRCMQTRHDVTVIAPAWRGWGRALRRPVRPPLVASDGVYRPLARPLVPGSIRSAARAYEAAVAGAIERYVHDRGLPDIIHAHVAFPGGFAAAKAGSRYAVPIVLTEHAAPLALLLTTPYATSATRWTYSHVNRVLAVGPTLREEILDLAPDASVTLLGNLVDTEEFRPDDGVDESAPASMLHRPLRLLSIGLQAPQKGIDVLLEAVRRLGDDGVDVELAVGGDGPSRAGLEALSERLGTQDRCRFIGRLARDQVRGWLHWCDLYVSASRRESFGVAIAEALACARPVVVTRSGGPEHFVEPEFGRVVAADNPAALATAISDVATGLSVLDGRAGRRYVAQHFGREAFLAQLDAVYDDVLTRR
jgi:L-malate glycosyltransferase